MLGSPAAGWQLGDGAEALFPHATEPCGIPLAELRSRSQNRSWILSESSLLALFEVRGGVGKILPTRHRTRFAFHTLSENHDRTIIHPPETLKHRQGYGRKRHSSAEIKFGVTGWVTYHFLNDFPCLTLMVKAVVVNMHRANTSNKSYLEHS